MNKYLTGLLFFLLIPLTVWGQDPEIKRERVLPVQDCMVL